MSGSSTYIGRFAPSPTGDLHLGSLVAALASFVRARQASGVWRLRIEDIDPPREVPGAAQRIVHDLGRLGLHHHGELLLQSTRIALYRQALSDLIDRGLAFPCWCSRQELAQRGGIHRGRCDPSPRAGRLPAWRCRVPAESIAFVDACQGPQHTPDLSASVGDFVVWRADDLPAYQLAVVVDDAAQHITEVVRGADLLDSTARQIWLQRALGYPQPHYLHVPLVLGAGGQKLSKQLQSDPIRATTPLTALHAAWMHLGQAEIAPMPDVDSWLRQACKRFQPERLNEAVTKRS